jgi:signal transduction histidine kinase
VLITIEDAGPGVPAEALEHLGTRFYRPAAARERSSGGSGLGLAIVREILRRHGGGLSFACPAGRGLSVTMSLPQAPPELQ